MRILIIVLILFSFRGVTGQEHENKKPKVGLVLSGGGAKGLAHIGVLKVLDELEIKVDYIAGTSMGGIIGGLYAIGYDAEKLEKIVLDINWNTLLDDKISRKELSMEEKEEEDRYFISFPIKENKIQLPSGLISGHHITKKLTRLTSSVYYQNDFNKLPIPFRCIATDIENGQQVILKEGNLAKAMRASMAIPTVFTPLELDGKLLVDGGLINNFPVQEVIDMGADFIIGVNVGFQYYSKNELNNMLKIVEQSVFLHQADRNEKSKSLCDVLITPPLKNFNASSFNDADTLISLGELAARKHLDTLRSLSDLLKKFPEIQRKMTPLDNLPPVKINQVKINGLNKVSDELIMGKLGFTPPCDAEVDEIEKATDRIYSSRYFEKVTYELIPEKNGVILQLDVIEKEANFFRVGAHYDSDFKSLLILNASLRNLLFKGSKLSVDFGLGSNPRGRITYFVHTNWKQSLSIGIRSNLDYLDIYGYENGEKINSFRYVDENAALEFKSNFKSMSTLGAGLQFQRARLKQRIGISDFDIPGTNLFNIYAFFDFDTYNRTFYPTEGIKTSFETTLSSKLDRYEKPDKNYVFSFMHKHAHPITKRLTIIENYHIGLTFGDSTMIPNYFLLGGLGKYNNLFPFIGLNIGEYIDSKALLARYDFQVRMWRNIFTTFHVNVGKSASDMDILLFPDNFILGYGISFGYNSGIGPIELTLMSANRNHNLISFVNIGVWF